MTDMFEKPQSKRAKSFNRFSGTQDHGTAAAEKALRPNRDLVDEAWARHEMEHSDKAYLHEVIRDALYGEEEYEASVAVAEAKEEALARAEVDAFIDDLESLADEEPADAEDASEEDDDFGHAVLYPAELGIRSLKAKNKAEAKAATLDASYDEDDQDDYYETGMSVRKLR